MQITSLMKKGKYFSLKTEKGDTLPKIHPDILLEFGLYEGGRIEDEILDEVREKNEFRFAWESTLRMLSLRAHCEQDIKNKLRKKGFTPSAISKVMQECKRVELIDDAKFAKAYIRELKENGSGLKMIKQKLFHKGVPRELIDSELKDSFTQNDEIEAAKTALRKKLPSLKREKDPRKRKEKLYRYMASRGFSYEVIGGVKLDVSSF